HTHKHEQGEQQSESSLQMREQTLPRWDCCHFHTHTHTHTDTHNYRTHTEVAEEVGLVKIRLFSGELVGCPRLVQVSFVQNNRLVEDGLAKECVYSAASHRPLDHTTT